MKKADAVKVFGSQGAIARLCGLTPQAVSLWPDTVPLAWSYYLAAHSDGKLVATGKPKRKRKRKNKERRTIGD